MTPPFPHLRYLEPTQESGRAFVMRGMQGGVVMLNLLRFRETADYSANLELAPKTPISGAEAFDHYICHTLPRERKLGASRLPCHGGPRRGSTLASCTRA